MGKPEKEIHTHNSIPCYFDDIKEGCCVCIRNKAIDDYERFLPDEKQIQHLINVLKPEFLAKAIAKRIGTE